MFTDENRSKTDSTSSEHLCFRVTAAPYKKKVTSLLLPPRPHFRFVRPFLYISIPIMNGSKVSSSLFEKKEKKERKKKGRDN